MRRIPSILTLTAAVALSAAVAACGENSPSTPAERSPAVSAPAEGVPGQAAPEAAATPEQQSAPPRASTQDGRGGSPG